MGYFLFIIAGRIFIGSHLAAFEKECHLGSGGPCGDGVHQKWRPETIFAGTESGGGRDVYF